jgi:signal transduction histidine kinase
MDRMSTSGDLWTTWWRLLSANWLALLLPLVAADTLGLFDGPLPTLFLILTAAVALFAPAEGAKLAPFALLAYGGYGLFLQHSVLLGQYRTVTYGILQVGSADNAGWVLPQAAVFLAAGVWLLAVTRAPGGGPVRHAVAQLRGTDGQPKTVPALLLLPAIFLWEELFSEQLWFGWFGWFAVGRVVAILLAAVAVVLVVKLPRAAASLSVVGIGLIGLYGVLFAGYRIWHGAPAPLGNVPYTTLFYGAVPVNSGTSGLPALVQSVVLLGFAGLLVPRLVTWGTDAELASRARALASRVDRLTRTRTGASEVAIAELRRIERDLHDGAQARLVAVGMSLRAAEQLMPTSPDAALALVAEARETSSRALADLRDLVRGIYPPVLADRGLADAVRALALDTPLEVTVDVGVPEEPPMPVAAAVYFGIAEAITNAVVHAGATTVQVHVAQAGDTLRAQVTDDGHGGADPSLGTGLAGVERRLAAFDGILAVSSPAGGPTIVAIEVPCVSSSAKTSTS